MNTYFSYHNHSEFSNLSGVLDSTNKLEDVIKYAHSIGLSGLMMSEHETLAEVFDLFETRKKLRASGEIPQEFKISIADEIYLVDKEEVKQKVENKEPIKWNHFLIGAKNKHGYEGLMRISSKAWDNSFQYRSLQRKPTYMDELEEIMKEYKGDIFATSACLGSYSSTAILEGKRWGDWAQWCVKVFGKDNFYFECQPIVEAGTEQDIVNKALYEASKRSGIKLLVATDSHYLNKDEAKFHAAFLGSQNAEREVESFYQTCYFHSYDELKPSFDQEWLDEMCQNTLDLMDSIEEFEVARPEFVSAPDLSKEKELNFYYPNEFFNKTPIFDSFFVSKDEVERYFAQLILKGIKEHDMELNDKFINRLEHELDIVRDLSIQRNEPLANYFVLMTQLMRITWLHSFVGVGRGSAGAFMVNYLLEITQYNGFDYDLFPERFLNKEKAELADVDYDSAASIRIELMESMREFFGQDNVINFGTYQKLASASSILSACRSFGMDVVDANAIKHKLPMDMEIEEALYGEHPCADFCEAVREHEGLEEVIVKMQGIIKGGSVHASAIAVTSVPHYELFAKTKTKDTKAKHGIFTTQGNMYAINGMGVCKYD